MNDRDSINLEQAYAHANLRREILAEWDDMSDRIIQTRGDQLVSEGVLDEGMWDSIKSGAGKVAGAVGGAYQAAKGAVKDKLMMPLVKMLQQKFPDALNQLVTWAQQNPNATDFSPVADPAVSESIYYHMKTINEDTGKDYPLDDLWDEASRVESQGKLENAWGVFDEMVNEAGPQIGGTAVTPPDHNAPAAKRYTGSVRSDVMTLKNDVKEFLAANPKMASDGRFKQIEDLISNLDREGRAKPGAAEPAELGGDLSAGDTPASPSTDAQLANPGDVPPVLGTGAASTPATPAATSGNSGGFLSKAWNWMKQNPGKAATVGGLAALLLFVGLTPITLLGLIRGVGAGLAQGAAMADPSIAGQEITTQHAAPGMDF
ncbi:hypothetical protein H8E06_00715 [bacterium]|nr:hypothetical protein [bacterium]